MITASIPFCYLFLDPTGRKDHYGAMRAPAVWKVEDGRFLIIGGRIPYMDLVKKKTKPYDLVKVRIVDTPTIEEAIALVRRKVKTRTPSQTKPVYRPLLNTILRVIDRIKMLDIERDLSPGERGFLAALDFVSTGRVQNWPRRVFIAVHGRSPDIPVPHPVANPPTDPVPHSDPDSGVDSPGP